MGWIEIKDFNGFEYLINISNISLINKQSGTIIVNGVTGNKTGILTVGQDIIEKIENIILNDKSMMVYQL